MRMLANFLPLLRRAEHLRRVITILAGTFEGKLYTEDISGRKTPLRDARAHLTSAMTLALEGFARQAPEVSFIHNYPGAVDTNLIRAESGWYMQPMKWWTRFMFRNQWVSYEECGERHCFLGVSDRYPAKKGGEQGVKCNDELDAAQGTDDVVASGVYTVDAEGQSGGNGVHRTLEDHRKHGHVEFVQQHLDSEFIRITGLTHVEVQGSVQG